MRYRLGTAVALAIALPLALRIVSGTWVYDVPVAGAYAVTAFLTWRAKATSGGFRLRVVGNPAEGGNVGILYEHVCRSCTDGVQTRNYNRTTGEFEGWGPMPPEHNVIYRKHDYFQALPANARPCIHCQGLGFLRLPYPPRASLRKAA